VWRESFYFFLPIISALLITASFPKFDLGILAWFGLSPLLFALRNSSLLGAIVLGFLFGGYFVVGAFSWALSITPINLVSFFVGLIIFSFYFLIFGFLYKLFTRIIGSWIILGAPCLWVTLEYVRSNLSFLSWPWNLLGHSQYSYLPVIQISDITGVYGISFLIVMANQFLSQIPEFFSEFRAIKLGNRPHHIFQKRLTIHLLIVAVLLVFTLSYGWYKIGKPEDSRHLRVALLQANVLTKNYMPLAEQVEHLRAYEELTRVAGKEKPDLIVWPASSLPAPIKMSPFVRDTVTQIAHDTQAHLLVGGAGYEKLRPQKEREEIYANSEFLISPSGHLGEQYNKIHLIPFNEYIPLQGKIPWPKWITTLKENFVPGKEYTLFQVSGVKFATPICWENMFPDLFGRFVKDGAQFMVSVTNEGFFGKTSAPYQSLAINVFRAVENRIAVVRSATTGISAFINPNGEIVERVEDIAGRDIFVSGFRVRDIPLSNKKTFYTVYGDIFTYVVIGITVLMILASFFKQKGLCSR
jgi:apolipoprotein N-acyltransferase